HIPVIPPSESPTRCARATPRSSSSASTSPPRSARSYGPSGTGEAPWPRVSYRTTRQPRSTSGATCGSHMRWSLPIELENTTTGPSSGPPTTRSTATPLTPVPPKWTVNRSEREEHGLALALQPHVEPVTVFDLLRHERVAALGRHARQHR